MSEWCDYDKLVKVLGEVGDAARGPHGVHEQATGEGHMRSSCLVMGRRADGQCWAGLPLPTRPCGILGFY